MILGLRSLSQLVYIAGQFSLFVLLPFMFSLLSQEELSYVTSLTPSPPNHPSLFNTGALVKPFTVSKQIAHQALPCHRTIDIGPDAFLVFGRDHREARQPLRTRRFGDRTLRYRNARIRTRSEGKDVEANEREERRRVERRTSRSAGREV